MQLKPHIRVGNLSKEMSLFPYEAGSLFVFPTDETVVMLSRKTPDTSGCWAGICTTASIQLRLDFMFTSVW